MNAAEEDRLFAELAEIHKTVSDIAVNGCAHAWQHKEHADRLLKIEGQQAEMRGKAAAAGGLVAIAASAFFAWIGRQL